MAFGLAPGAHLALKQREKLSLHSQESLLVGLRHEVSEARVAFKLGRDVRVLGNLNDLPVEDMRWVIRAANPNEGALAIGTARMCDVPKPSAVLAEDAHGLKIQALMEHGTYTELSIYEPVGRILNQDGTACNRFEVSGLGAGLPAGQGQRCNGDWDFMFGIVDFWILIAGGRRRKDREETAEYAEYAEILRGLIKC
jgi:hypothetical protein